MTTPRLIHEGTPDEAVVLPVEQYVRLYEVVHRDARQCKMDFSCMVGVLDPSTRDLLPPLESLRTGREPEKGNP